MDIFWGVVFGLFLGVILSHCIIFPVKESNMG
jgi:hypothetical protein